MCLMNIDKKLAQRFGTGYKLVRKRGYTYECYDHIDHAGTVTYPINQWITDPKDGEIGYQLLYRTGFHISLDRKPLENLMGRNLSPDFLVLIKVRFRKVTATSCDNPDSCYGRQVVARELMNLGEQ